MSFVLNNGGSLLNFDDDDFDDDLAFDADGEIVENGEFEMMLGVPSFDYAEAVANKRRDVRFDRMIDGPKPKTTRRRHSRGDNIEDDDEEARPLSMNRDANGEELLGVPGALDWQAISRGTAGIVHNDSDGDEQLLGTPVPNWEAIAQRERR